MCRYAQVGDKVFHRWECTTEAQGAFGMLVHDCYVDDGQGQRVQIINERGSVCDFEGLTDYWLVMSDAPMIRLQLLI